MPSISAITVTGSGSATSAMRSPPPLSANRVASSVAICRIRGRSDSTIRGVNALDTSRRSRVWTGGSTSSIPARTTRQNGSWNSGSGCRPNSSCVATCR